MRGTVRGGRHLSCRRRHCLQGEHMSTDLQSGGPGCFAGRTGLEDRGEGMDGLSGPV